MGLNGPPDRHSVIAQPTIRPVVLLLIVALHSAACSSSGPATTSLFAINESRLSKSDQEAITRIFESFSDDSSCGELTPEAEVVDLNADGVQEVFVQWGNACTSGLTGRSLSLFIKDSSGSYQPQFGFPAFGWTRLDSESHGWPDLSFGGPGFCRPRWTWQRDAYEFKCNLPQIDGGCEFQVNVC